jgi:cytohesin
LGDARLKNGVFAKFFDPATTFIVKCRAARKPVAASRPGRDVSAIPAPTVTSRKFISLADAIRAGDVGAVTTLAAEPGSLTKACWWGFPLHLAARKGNCRVVDALLAAGAPMDAVGGGNLRTALHEAAIYDRAEVVTLLLQRGANGLAVDMRKRTNGDPGDTPFYFAAERARSRAAAVLLSCSLDEARGPRGWTPAHIAACRGDARALTQLRLSKAEAETLDSRKRGTGNRPLHLAAGSGSASAIQALLKAGADPNAKGDFGITPLHLAAFSGSVPAIEVLLRAGVDPMQKNTGRRTPLHCAAEGGSPSAVEILLKAGADPNAKDGNGRTPLHLAAEADSALAARFLLNAGADPNAKGMGDDPPLVEAAKFASVSTMQVLVKAGADLKASGEHCMTALHEAAKSGSAWAIEVLLEAGADPNWTGRHHHPPREFASDPVLKALLK